MNAEADYGEALSSSKTEAVFMFLTSPSLALLPSG
jgi:hypothetical protein